MPIFRLFTAALAVFLLSSIGPALVMAQSNDGSAAENFVHDDTLPEGVQGRWAFERGVRALQDGDTLTALQEWEFAASKGDLPAQWALAVLYEGGAKDIPVNRSKAFNYYFLAAEQNHIEAMVALAGYYRTGDKRAGVDKDLGKAFKLYEHVALQGHARAQHYIGEMYYYGEGVISNATRGMRWFLLAARKHLALSQMFLANMYWNGQGTPRNRVKGLMWQMIARQDASVENRNKTEDRFREMMAQAVPEEVQEARTLAAHWNRKYPKQG